MKNCATCKHLTLNSCCSFPNPSEHMIEFIFKDETNRIKRPNTTWCVNHTIIEEKEKVR